MYEVKKIQIWPFARSMALILTSAMVVIPIGVVFFISAVEGISWGDGFQLEDFFEILFEEDFLVGYSIAIPVTAGVSLAAASLGAWMYNFVSGRIGGIVLNIDYHQENQVSIQQPTQTKETDNNQS